MLSKRNVPSLELIQQPARTGALLGISKWLKLCNLFEPEDCDIQQWHESPCASLRTGQSDMQRYLASPFFQSLGAPRTNPFFMAVMDAPTGGSKIREPNFLRISEGAQHSRAKSVRHAGYAHNQGAVHERPERRVKTGG
jgi:hypothetical protein